MLLPPWGFVLLRGFAMFKLNPMAPAVCLPHFAREG